MTQGKRSVADKLAATSYSAIALEVGIDTSYVSHIMAGHRMPSIPVAQRMAKHLGVNLVQLVDYLDTIRETVAV